MPAVLADVDNLSDDDFAGDGKIERQVDTLSDDDLEILGAKFTKSEKRKSLQESRDLAKARERLSLVVKSKCRCKSAECRQQFRGKDEFERLLALRMRIWSMDKPRADQEAGYLFVEKPCFGFLFFTAKRHCCNEFDF